MVQLIFKDNIEQNKLDALVQFLKTMDIETEIKSNQIKSKPKKHKNKLSLAVGMWKDYEIDGKELRTNAWKRNI